MIVHKQLELDTIVLFGHNKRAVKLNIHKDGTNGDEESHAITKSYGQLEYYQQNRCVIIKGILVLRR